jgi:hypothetical protein
MMGGEVYVEGTRGMPSLRKGNCPLLNSLSVSRDVMNTSVHGCTQKRFVSTAAQGGSLEGTDTLQCSGIWLVDSYHTYLLTGLDTQEYLRKRKREQSV